MTNDEGMTKFRHPAEYIVLRVFFVIPSLRLFALIRVIRGLNQLIARDRPRGAPLIATACGPRLPGRAV